MQFGNWSWHIWHLQNQPNELGSVSLRETVPFEIDIRTNIGSHCTITNTISYKGEALVENNTPSRPDWRQQIGEWRIWSWDIVGKIYTFFFFLNTSPSAYKQHQQEFDLVSDSIIKVKQYPARSLFRLWTTVSHHKL